jgi:lipoprotein-anchoring transpeptidase ErfK/SrfK
MSHHPPTQLHAARRRVPVAGALVALTLTVAGCTAIASSNNAQSGSPEASDTPATPAVTVASNVAAQASAVPVNKLLTLTATDGSFKKVNVTAGKASIKGFLSADQSTWTASELLEPGTTYTVRSVAVDDNGLARRTSQQFTTQSLTLSQQTYPSVAPMPGETVGVGMPVIITFDVPVTDEAAIEKHLSVESSPKQAGAWHWLSDHEVHWRPKKYWKAGTDVTVHADINSIPAGNGVFGQLSRTTKFHVGDSVIMNVDVTSHVMRVHKNGQLLRTIPISAGKPGFTTRSGIKVIIEKFRHKRMNAATINIKPGDPNYYNLDDVEYAQRVTYSGEFLHAAPWSVGSQGSANVSHGCVGMSTENAAWLYGLTKRGDVVDVTGTERHMTLDNGYGDWNESFADYRTGSALS